MEAFTCAARICDRLGMRVDSEMIETGRAKERRVVSRNKSAKNGLLPLRTKLAVVE